MAVTTTELANKLLKSGEDPRLQAFLDEAEADIEQYVPIATQDSMQRDRAVIDLVALLYNSRGSSRQDIGGTSKEYLDYISQRNKIIKRLVGVKLTPIK